MFNRSLPLRTALFASIFACGSTLPRVPASTTPIEADALSADGVAIHYVVEGRGRAVVDAAGVDYAGFTNEQLPSLMPKKPNPAVFARVHRDAMAALPERTATILESLWEYREDVAMDQLALPIVVVASDVRPVALDHNRAHAPQFDARILAETGHWLMLDKPTEFADTLRAVIEAMESGNAKRRS